MSTFTEKWELSIAGVVVAEGPVIVEYDYDPGQPEILYPTEDAQPGYPEQLDVNYFEIQCLGGGDTSVLYSPDEDSHVAKRLAEIILEDKEASDE